MPALRLFFPSAASLLTDHRPHGEGLIAWNFLSELARRGHEIVACAREVDVSGEAGFRIVQVGSGSSLESIEPLLYARRVRRVFETLGGRERFDLAHWMFPPGDEEILFHAPPELPYVIGPQQPEWPDSPGAGGVGAIVRWLLRPVFRVARRRAWSSAAAVMLSSPPARTTVPDFCRAPTALVPFGINAGAFRHLPLPDRPTIAFVGRLEEQKGVRDLLLAFRQVRAAVPAARLVIAGDGPLRAAVESDGRSLPPGALQLLGNVPNRRIAEVLGSASLLCVPSHGEPYGMAILEAMSCGRAAVAYEWGGPRFLVDHGRGGLLVAPETGPTGIGAALVELLNDPHRLEAMGRYNRTRALEQFSWEQVAAKAEEVYLSIAGPSAYA